MKNIYETSIATAAVVLAAMTLAACTTTDPTRVEEDFGNSVRHMVNAQIYDQEAAQNPPKDPPMGIDAVQAEAVLKVYREHVGDPEEVTDTLRINISD